MKPQTFLRTLLLAPLIVPLVASAFGYNPITFVLVMSLAVGGLPYLVTAPLLWFRFGRCTSEKSAIALILAAPLVYSPLLALAWLLVFLTQDGSTGSGIILELVVSLGLAQTMGLYGLLLGYVYAIFAAIIFRAVIRAGLVSGFASVEPHSAEANAA